MPTLAELAQRLRAGLPELQLVGDGSVAIDGVCTLEPGEPGKLSFLANPLYRSSLAGTRAAAVILGRKDAAGYGGAALVAKDPYLAFARAAALFDTSAGFTPGVDARAAVAAGVAIPPCCGVAAGAVVEPGVTIGAGTYIGPGAVVGRSAHIGEGCRIEARAVIGERVTLGARVRVNPGAVVGSRGFGLARGPQGWEEVPQLGSVRIGDDVEIGANTTIDRGALGDTVIENGVKLDNQIQIAHNVRIGAHTAIAACVGIAGSTKIGARCLIGGGAGVSGHLEIGDDVAVMGWTMVTRSLDGPGQYGSGSPAQPVREWRRSIARVRRLGALEQRLAELERRAGIRGAAQGGSGDDEDV